MDKACKALLPFATPSACFDTIRKNSNQSQNGADDETYGVTFSPFAVMTPETRIDQTMSSDKLSYIKVVPTSVAVSHFPEAI